MTMSELHSLAYTCSSSDSLAWDSSDLGFLNADAMSLGMDHDAIEPSFSPTESDVSTGYLEDALVEFSSKRRRLLLYTNPDELYQNFTPPNDHLLLQSYWSSCCTWDDVSSENFNWMNQIYNMNYYDAVSTDEPISSTSPKSRISEETNINRNLSPEMKSREQETFLYEDPNCSSSSSKHSVNAKFSAEKETVFSIDSKPISGGGGDTTRKNKKKKRLVYPFAVVKPGGVEGDMTLKDINQRILMAPTRPVRHPVGDFACRPCVSADGTGLSGKAVVALTRIHTQGRRGTITIIRTKG